MTQNYRSSYRFKHTAITMLILFGMLSTVYGQTGRIKGVVTDKSSKETVIGATVFIKALGIGGATDIDGNYVLVNVPAGTHTLTCSYVGYMSQNLTVVVVEGQTSTLNFILAPDQGSVLQEVVVEANRVTNTEAKVLEDRRKSGNIQDAISLQQMERMAALNTAQALQKVPGVSLRDGKRVTVRGLSGRNLVVQMNGARLPSANPEQSDVPVDLIPSQVLDNVTVEKSITPDKPGDATGAVIEIKTRSIPEELFVGVTGQIGFNSNVGWFGQMLSFKNANMGFWGTGIRRFNLSQEFLNLREQYADGGLATSDETINRIRQALANGTFSSEENTEAQRINRIFESFDPVLSTSVRGNIAPNQVYSISFGNRYDGDRKFLGINLGGDRQIGIFLGLNYYRRSQSFRNGQNNRFSTREAGRFLETPNILNPTQVQLLRRFSFREDYAEEALNYGGLGTFTFKFDRANQISLTYNNANISLSVIKVQF